MQQQQRQHIERRLPFSDLFASWSWGVFPISEFWNEQIPKIAIYNNKSEINI